MSNRVTVSNVEGAFKRLCRSLTHFGFDPNSIVLDHGSRVSGIAFTVRYVDSDDRRQLPLPNYGRFGMTRAEAFHGMADTAEILESVIRLTESAQ